MEEQEKLEAELLDVGVADQLPETPREEPAAAVEKPQEVLVNETVSQGKNSIKNIDRLGRDFEFFPLVPWVS